MRAAQAETRPLHRSLRQHKCMIVERDHQTLIQQSLNTDFLRLQDFRRPDSVDCTRQLEPG